MTGRSMAFPAIGIRAAILPDRFGPDADAWAAWLRQHGIDPGVVLLGAHLVAIDEERRVLVDAVDVDERGHIQPDGHGGPRIIYRAYRLEAPAPPSRSRSR